MAQTMTICIGERRITGHPKEVLAKMLKILKERKKNEKIPARMVA